MFAKTIPLLAVLLASAATASARDLTSTPEANHERLHAARGQRLGWLRRQFARFSRDPAKRVIARYGKHLNPEEMTVFRGVAGDYSPVAVVRAGGMTVAGTNTGLRDHFKGFGSYYTPTSIDPEVSKHWATNTLKGWSGPGWVYEIQLPAHAAVDVKAFVKSAIAIKEKEFAVPGGIPLDWIKSVSWVDSQRNVIWTKPMSHYRDRAGQAPTSE